MAAFAVAEPEPLMIASLRRRGLEDFEEHDPAAAVETPRSLEACAAEGIRPEDLSFVPPEAFLKPGVAPEVARLRSQYFEARRQDLLAMARRARAAQVAGEPPPHSMSPRADLGSQYRHAFAFFKETLYALDLNVIPVKADWTTSPRSPEFKRVDPYAAHRCSSSAASRGPSNVPTFMATGGSVFSWESEPESMPMSPTSPNTTANSWWATTASSWRTTTSEDALRDLLGQIRDAPGSDWREHESARRTEDTFGSGRQVEFKALQSRQYDEARLLRKRLVSIDKSFKTLKFDQQRKDRYREIREAMAPPKAVAAHSDGQGRARANVIKMTEQAEVHRREQFDKRVRAQHELEQFIDSERFQTKIKFSQMTLEDRVRWRHNYAAVEEKKVEEREGVLEDFRRKQAQLDGAAKRAAEVGALKREVMKLRCTHRTFEECRQKRKEEHEDALRRHQLRELGERRIEEMGGRISMPQGRLLPRALSALDASFIPASPAVSVPASPVSTRPGLVDFSDTAVSEPLSPKEMRWMQKVLRRPRAAVPGARFLRSASAPGFGPVLAPPSPQGAAA